MRGTKAAARSCFCAGVNAAACAEHICGEDVMDDWSSVRLCDVVNFILSGVLFFSPWLFDLSNGAQWQTASVAGLIIAVLSIAALAAFAVWEEWFILIAGLVLIVSPWLLGFQNSDARMIDVVIGGIVAVLAATEVWLTQEKSVAPEVAGNSP
jgi:SPW repeat